jgi:hypothetical protein
VSALPPVTELAEPASTPEAAPPLDLGPEPMTLPEPAAPAATAFAPPPPTTTLEPEPEPEPAPATQPEQEPQQEPQQEAQQAAAPAPAAVAAATAGGQPRGGDAATATLGELYLRQGHLAEAEKIFHQVLARDAENEIALRGLEAAGRRRVAALSASELLTGDETEVRGVSARKILLLQRYLHTLRRGAGRDVPGTSE